ncbi:MAG TPA: chromosomal replication initiator protein DnaA [Phycisphaerales bacterium]|nr:chromosomal replication initiator protein DnaA [Phycisphaerales bacterium]
MTDPDRQIWDSILSHLRSNYQGICRAWFAELEPAGISAGALHVRAQSVVHRDYLRRECSDAFNDACRTVSGMLLPVRFLGPADDINTAGPAPKSLQSHLSSGAGSHAVLQSPPRSSPIIVESANPPMDRPEPEHNGDATIVTRRVVPPPPPAPVHTPPHNAASALREGSMVLNPDYSFDHFVVGSGNRLAHAAMVAVSDNPGRSYNPVFIHGGSGLGKTHLLQAACLKITAENPAAQIYFISCDGFINQFIDAVTKNQMSEFRHRFRDVDVLVIDDIHFLAKRERTQEEFFHTFNSLYQANKQIVLSSDAAPEEIPDLEDRLISRFKWGLVTKVEPPDFETRVAILKTKAALRDVIIPDDVAAFIANRIDKHIRELEGAIVKLQNRSHVDKRPIDIDMARAEFGEEAVPEGGPTIQVIITRVTEYFRVKVTELQSKRRSRSVALPRQVCMYLARKHTRHSLEEIGGYFGGRDHTTVMHAVKTIDHKRATEPDFDETIKALEEKVRSNR